MTDCVEVHWTCGSIDEARRVCRYLVQEGYVACAQIVPWLESIYLWDEQIRTDQETKVILKTSASRFEDVKQVIQQNSTYEVPEISMIRIEEGNEEYLQWLAESTQKKAANK